MLPERYATYAGGGYLRPRLFWVFGKTVLRQVSTDLGFRTAA